jgi:type II secretory pathway pseudopilin PulG
MKATRQKIQSRVHREVTRGEAAFTMVEIALCLGIIAFALVAIIGVLPTGIRVQKENREDTVINQDGTFLLEAIRSGSRNLDYLTNFFDSITLSNRNQIVIFTNSPGLDASLGGKTRIEGSLTNGLRVVGLLTFPKYSSFGANVLSNSISGHIRALSGSAVDKSKLTKDFAFAYQFTSEVIALSPYPPEFTNYRQGGLSADEVVTRSNLWLMARNQAANFNELRLTLQGPVIRKGQTLEAIGTPKTFRTIISGSVSNAMLNYFVQPSTFVQVFP